MDTNDLRAVVKRLLHDLTVVPYAHGDIKLFTVFDEKNDHYLVMLDGWDVRKKRVHGVLVHADIIGNKVWVQRDGSEEGIAVQLEAAGVPKSQIVLGFRPMELRKHMDYALA